MTYDRATSPIGWYVGSYLLRFIEQNAEGNDDLEKKFLVWENTILVEAASFEAAYAKLCEFAARETGPYKGGTAGIDVQWVFEGVSELLPIYEEMKDGAEIMWVKYDKKLKNIRKRARSLEKLKKGNPPYPE
jgi:hypothetical protein